MILEQFLTNQLFVFSIAKLASVTRITPEYGKNNSNSFDANRIAMNLETSEFSLLYLLYSMVIGEMIPIQDGKYNSKFLIFQDFIYCDLVLSDFKWYGARIKNSEQTYSFQHAILLIDRIKEDPN